MKTNSTRIIIAGVFVAIGVAALFATVMVIGKEKRLFGEQIALRTYFLDVQGLQAGAPVRLAGVAIGKVDVIEFAANQADKRILVRLSIEKSASEKLRGDSVASIASSGLLGDKLVNVTMGTPKEPSLKDGDELKSIEPPDYFKFVEKGQLILDKGALVADNLAKLLENAGSDQNMQNFASMLKRTDNILKQVEQGPGLAHMALYDKNAPKQASTMLASLADASTKLNTAMAKIDAFTKQLEKNDGLLNTLLHDKRGEEIVTTLNKTMTSLNEIIGHVQNEDGILHTLVYKSADLNFLKELNEASAKLKVIIEGVQKGQGTVGALITDDTIYEDLKEILGGIKRNKVIKALFRYSISSAEKERNKPEEKVKEKK